jgi:transcriptional regulator with XRE-family HTH domain
MRRITDEEIAFYDRVAERISNLLGNPSCSLTQSSLAKRVGWNRPSLCNFINRIDKGVAAHFIPRIARVLGVPMDYLIDGAQLKPPARNLWDPRFDDARTIVEKCDEFRRRKLHSLSLTSVLPLQALPDSASVANFVNSMVNGASEIVAERWHEAIEREREQLLSDGCENIDYLIPIHHLLRLPRRLAPYQGFSSEEIIELLQYLKKEWVRKRGMRIIAVDDSMLDPDVRLELSGNIILSVLGREMQIRFHKDLRIDWDDAPGAVNISRESLIKLKRAAGFGVRDRPSAEQVETLIDTLLAQVDLHERSASPSLRNQVESGLNGFEERHFAIA